MDIYCSGICERFFGEFHIRQWTVKREREEKKENEIEREGERNLEERVRFKTEKKRDKENMDRER